MLLKKQGYQALADAVRDLGADNPFAQLVPDLSGESWTTIGRPGLWLSHATAEHCAGTQVALTQTMLSAAYPTRKVCRMLDTLTCVWHTV